MRRGSRKRRVEVDWNLGNRGRNRREAHLSDAPLSVLPMRPNKVYVVSDSRLKLRKAKTKGGNQGSEVTTAERLKTLGTNDTEYSIKPCVELMHLMKT